MTKRGAPRAARLVIVDALADGAEFHLCRDDYFLAETLHDAFDELRVYTAVEGVSAIRRAALGKRRGTGYSPPIPIGAEACLAAAPLYPPDVGSLAASRG